MVNNHSYPADKCTFELLSAYLDGEVTAQQRQEVQTLLHNNPEAQQLYRRLLILRQKIHNLPIPEPEYSSSELSEAVFARVDQEDRHRRKRWVWGGSAIAALVVATVSGIFSESRTPIWQMAQQDDTQEHLIITLNEPLIELPEQRDQEKLMIPLSEPLL